MGMAEVSDYLSKILGVFNSAETSWGNISIAGTSLQTAASTTYPPNSRFAFLKNNDFLDASEVPNEVTHNRPLYTITVSPGDEWIVKNQQRDFYIPGFDSALGIAGQFENVPSGNFVPDGVVWEGGNGGFRSGDTEDIAVTNTVSRQGAVMRAEEESAELRIYKDGTVANSLPLKDWEFDPFNDRAFKFHLGKFFVLRVEFDLYGAGDFTFFLKIRDVNGVSHLKKLGSIGLSNEPALKEYNLHSGAIITLDSSISSGIDYSVGPIEYHNEIGEELPDRTKGEVMFNVDISTTVTSNDETVVAVYRLQPDKVEVPTQVEAVTAEMASTGGSNEEAIAQVRQVHRNFLTFPQDTDPDDDSNWLSLGATPTDASYTASPPTSLRESSVEKLDVGENEVTLSTFTDDDGETKVRGEEESFVELTTENQSRRESRDISAEAFMNELKYLVVLGSISDTSINFRKIRVDTGQIW